jgi:hypothetical protein
LQKHKARQTPLAHVFLGAQLSETNVIVQAPPPSEPLLNTHRPVGVNVCNVSTSHC